MSQNGSLIKILIYHNEYMGRKFNQKHTNALI